MLVVNFISHPASRVRYLSTIFLIFCTALSAFSQQAVTIEEARKIYAESMDDKATCEAAYLRFASVKNSGNPLLTGYKGAITVAMSKHEKTTKAKISFFNDGKKLIESAVLEDNLNAELRFIRFTIQTNVPAALKYNKNIEADKKFIIDHFSTIKNADIRSRIKKYMLQSKNVTAEEKQKINAL
jgi:hypothetical protein